MRWNSPCQVRPRGLRLRLHFVIACTSSLRRLKKASSASSPGGHAPCATSAKNPGEFRSVATERANGGAARLSGVLSAVQVDTPNDTTLTQDKTHFTAMSPARVLTHRVNGAQAPRELFGDTDRDGRLCLQQLPEPPARDHERRDRPRRHNRCRTRAAVEQSELADEASGAHGESR